MSHILDKLLIRNAENGEQLEISADLPKLCAYGSIKIESEYVGCNLIVSMEKKGFQLHRRYCTELSLSFKNINK